MARTKLSTQQNNEYNNKYKEVKKLRMIAKKSQQVKNRQARRDATNQTHTYLKEESLEVSVALWRTRVDLFDTLEIFDDLKAFDDKVMEDTKSCALFKIPKSDPTLSTLLSAVSKMDIHNLTRTKEMLLSIIDFIEYNCEESPTIYALEKEKIANAHKVIIMACQSIKEKEKKLERIASPDVGSIDFDDAFSVAFASGEMEVAPSSIHLSSAGVSAVASAVAVARPANAVDVLTDLGYNVTVTDHVAVAPAEVRVRSGPPKKNDESTWRSFWNGREWLGFSPDK